MRNLLAYSKGTTIEEKLTLRIKADNSGDIYIPTAWYSYIGTQDCEYWWKVSIDGGEWEEYRGIWSSNWKIRVWYGLTPLSIHTVAIKPIVDRYGWLRAFWYKGTDIASSLINIVSDISYKWYAVSDKFSGDYYKAYQYYGCNNLASTDEELLPDTLEIIWDYYRYYEYYGCTSLVSNADEKILKTVKVIGDYYRAYQYQNCSNINRINMRAINWASVGNNYRYNQYKDVANDRKQVSIYIEWGIEEWGDWWLIDANVKWVYVYKDLISDYQTKLSGITNSKIQKNADWDNYEYEFIEFIALADSSGKIRIPIGWFSTTMSQDCAYDWMISIDGWSETEYTGIGDDNYFSIGSGLTSWSEHRIVIKPKTIGYGWWRAFGYYSTWAEAYIKELIHDSYKWYAVSRVDTWAHYKHATFVGCTNLINSYEKLPTSVETIWDYYMKECYAGCTGLKTAFYEVLNKSATVWVDYRHHEYTGCTALEVHQWIAWYTGTTYPTNYKYEYLSWAGNNMEVYFTRYEKLDTWLTNSLWIADNKVGTLYCFVDDIARYRNNSLWNTFATSTKWQAYYYGYVCDEWIDINWMELEWNKTLIFDYSSNNFYDMWNWWITIFDGDILAISRRWTSSNWMAVRPALASQPLSELWVSSAVNRWTLTSWSTDWYDRWVKRVGHTRRLWYAYDRLDYPNYAYWSVYWFNSLDSFGSSAVWFTPWTIPTQNHEWVDLWLGASANGQYVWCRVEGQTIQNVFLTPFSWWRIATRLNNITGWTSMEFSDDWMRMYVQSGDTIKQYNLPSPWYVEWAVDSGKTLKVDGWCFTIYKGCIYTNSGKTIYKYK